MNDPLTFALTMLAVIAGCAVLAYIGTILFLWAILSTIPLPPRDE